MDRSFDLIVHGQLFRTETYDCPVEPAVGDVMVITINGEQRRGKVTRRIFTEERGSCTVGYEVDLEGAFAAQNRGRSRLPIDISRRSR